MLFNQEKHRNSRQQPCQKLFAPLTLQGDLVIEGSLPWAPATEIPPLSPDTGGGGGERWLFWDWNADGNMKLMKLRNLQRLSGAGQMELMAKQLHEGNKGTESIAFKKTAARWSEHWRCIIVLWDRCDWLMWTAEINWQPQIIRQQIRTCVCLTAKWEREWRDVWVIN